MVHDDETAFPLGSPRELDERIAQFLAEQHRVPTLTWAHVDVLRGLRGDAAIAFAASTDFRVRAVLQERERVLHEVITYLASVLPDRP